MYIDDSIEFEDSRIDGNSRNEMQADVLEMGNQENDQEVVSDSQHLQQQNPQQQVIEDDDLPLFCISKHDAKDICQVVKAMSFREHCILSITNEGVQMTVDDQHNQQGSAYFKIEQFQEFNLRIHACNLKVPLKPFIEALNMFTGSMTLLQISWNGDGCPLLVILEDEGMVVHTEIRTLIAPAILDFEYNDAQVLCKAILNPQPIREFMRDLDDSAETVVITFTANYLQFYMVGGLGRMKVEIPSSSEQLELLNCTRDRVQFRYRMVWFKRLKEVIRLCNKISFRIDQRGIFCAQMMVPQNEQNMFIVFYTITENEQYYEHES